MQKKKKKKSLISPHFTFRFRGIFVETHQAVTQRSSVTSEEHPDLTFTLELLRSQPTYAQPEQQWQFVSDFAVSSAALRVVNFDDDFCCYVHLGGFVPLLRFLS